MLVVLLVLFFETTSVRYSLWLYSSSLLLILTFDDIVRVMENELKGSGSFIGYRAMHQRLTVQHSLNVSRNIVRQVLKILDPEGVNAR